MSRHTQGPWWIGGDRPGEHPAVFPAIKAFVDGTNAITICKVGHNNQYKGQGGRDWPNARLIAAAPALLEALQKLLSSGTFDDYPNTNEWFAVRDARAAIARATGETA